jgi:hypothetical protein
MDKGQTTTKISRFQPGNAIPIVAQSISVMSPDCEPKQVTKLGASSKHGSSQDKPTVR